MWYSEGTVAVDNGSTNIVGTGTSFLTNARVGDGITITGSTALHEIIGVASNTQIVIRPAYDGPTGSGLTYGISPLLGYDKDLSDAFNSLRLQFGEQLSNLQPWATASTANEAREELGLGANLEEEIESKVSKGAVGSEEVNTSTGTQTVVEALDRRGVMFKALRAPTEGAFDPEDYLETSAKIQLGALCSTLGYYTAGDGGGNNYQLEVGGEGIADGGSRVDLSGSGLQAKALFSTGRNLLQFGAVADGDYEGGGTDNTLVVQRVYDYLENDKNIQSVSVLNKGTGCYRVDGPIYGRKNVTFIFEEGVTFDFTGSSLTYDSKETSGLWNIAGEWSGEEIPTSENLTISDTEIATVLPHGLSVGDMFLLKGQRNALHSDAGDWRLGRATGSVDHHALYFGEPCIVDEVISATSVKIRNGLIFPDYLTNNSEETSPAASRERTTIRKMNLLTGVKIVGGTFLVNNNSAFHCELTKNLEIRATTVNNNGTPGICYLSKYNYNAKFFDVTAVHPENNYLVEDHSRYNSFKSRTDWLTEWSYTDVNGMQGLDVSYDLGGTPTLFTDITKARTINNLESGLTFHSGAYGWKASNIYIIGSKKTPIFLRSRNGVLSDFFIEGLGQVNGIEFSEWAVDIAVANGRIKCGNDGFFIGTHFILPGDVNEQVEPKRNISMDSITIECGRRIGTIHNIPIETTEMSGITLTNFTILDFTDPLRIESYVNGLVANNWSARSKAVTNTNPAIEIFNSAYLNTVTNIRRLAPVAAPAVDNSGQGLDSALFPDSSFLYRTTGNVVKDCLSSTGGQGVVERDYIKAGMSGNFTLTNPVAREGVIELRAESINNRTLTLPAASGGSVSGIGIGVKVSLVNSNASYQLNVAAGEGALLDSSRYGAASIGPGKTATVELVRQNYWVMY